MTPKTILAGFGTLLALAGVGYVGFQLFTLSTAQDIFKPKLIGITLLAAMAYAVALLLLAKAWQRLLHHLGVHPAGHWLIRSYSDYQVAKYVPGNIANIVGRQVSGVRQGYSMKAMATSTALELGGMLVCGGLFWLLMAMIRLDWPLLIAMTVLSVCIGLVYIALLLANATRLFAALLMQLSFLALSGFIFCGVVAASIEPSPDWNLTRTVSVLATFNAAWLVGMLTPGAPAGVGVRDALLLTWVAPIIPSSSHLAVAILISRLSTVLGDLLFWIGARISCPPKH